MSLLEAIILRSVVSCSFSENNRWHTKYENRVNFLCSCMWVKVTKMIGINILEHTVSFPRQSSLINVFLLNWERILES